MKNPLPPFPWTVTAIDDDRAVIYDANDRRVTGLMARETAEFIVSKMSPRPCAFGRRPLPASISPDEVWWRGHMWANNDPE